MLGLTAGGGAAYAATYGGSTAGKPSTQKSQSTKPGSTRKPNSRAMQHNCPHMGDASRTYTSASQT
ncbi:MAG TPA: hypothetical protein VLJ76_00835 [Gaiellaceae bacterium]|nr:hypothetical protein [Gaiellaceae bacterium]